MRTGNFSYFPLELNVVIAYLGRARLQRLNRSRQSQILLVKYKFSFDFASVPASPSSFPRLIVSAHLCCAHKFTCHVIYRAL